MSVPRPTPGRARAAVLGLTVATLWLGGCASLSPAAPKNTQLAGQWTLIPASSDSAQKTIARRIAAAKQRLRHRLRPPAGPGAADHNTGEGGEGSEGGERGERGEGGEGTEGGSASQAGNAQAVLAFPGLLPPDFAALSSQLNEMLDLPRELRITVQSDTVLIQRDGLPPRSYEPGQPFSLFNAYGTAMISSGWSDTAFVVRERYTNHAGLTKRYQIDPRGRLTVTERLKEPALGMIALQAVYRRSPRRAAPGASGR